MRTFGKSLQVIGLVMLPVACLIEISNGTLGHYYVANMLKLMIFGVLAFVIGRFVEGFAR